LISQAEHPGRRARSSGAGARVLALIREFIAESTAPATARARRSRNAAERRRSYEHQRGKSNTGDGRTVEIEVSRSALALAVILAAALLFIAWCIVADTAADHRAVAKTKTNLVAVSAAAALLDQAALRQVKLENKEADLRAADTAVQKALRLDPLDTRALALLALVAERRNEPKRADAFMGLAAQRTWSDPMVQSWTFLRDLQRRDFAGAMTHADALLRTLPALRSWVFPKFVVMVANPPALRTLAAMLVTAPPWRRGFLTELCARIANTDQLTELYADLHQSSQPPSVEELGPYLVRLIVDDRYRDAYHSWVAMAAPKSGGDLNALPYDGDFSIKPSGLPFEWVLASVPGARIEIVPTPAGGMGHALRVEFSGARVNFQNVFQMLLLPPGDYHLSGLVRAQDLQTSRGLWWRILCAEPPKTTLAHTVLVSATTDWTRFGIDFRVPRNGCEAQWLLLELPARTDAEQQIAGEIWYRDLRITAGAAPAGAMAVQ
jgi:hypothetical protein